MKKKALISVGIILIIAGGIIFYISQVLLPQIRYENLLKDPDILCLTLKVSHGCSSENYNNEELERWLKEDVLTKISIEEVEEVVISSYKKEKQEQLEQFPEIEDKNYAKKKSEKILKYYNNLIPIIQKIKQEQE
jgi:hypothetical protein